MRYSIRERICASLVLLSSFSALHGAEERPLKRTFSFSSGYLTNASNYAFSNSNRALSNFYDELGMGYAAGFDALADLYWSKHNRTWFSLLNILINPWFAYVQNTGYHEFGHFSRFRAFGKDPRFTNQKNPGWSNGFKNPFSFTTYLLTRFRGTESTYSGPIRWVSSQAFVGTSTLRDIYEQGGYWGANGLWVYVHGHPNDPDSLQFKKMSSIGTLLL